MIGVLLDLNMFLILLIRKFFYLCYQGIMLEWVESYLADISQYVVYDGVQSIVLPIMLGVPQGYILIPLFFIIYTNAICVILAQIHMQMIRVY